MLLTSCSGKQSALSPAGRDAETIAELFWWMAGSAIAAWTVVVALTIYAIRVRPGPHDLVMTRRLVIGGGVIFPTVGLALLLTHGLASMPQLLALPENPRLRIAVTGEQWWWRVRYILQDGRQVELANEIRLPVGERALFVLESADVVHSFWVPALGGKVDMIPGRTTHLALEPTRVGRFRGVCAEFCGASHTHMNFDVVVSDSATFDSWLEFQFTESRAPASEPERRGREQFLRSGCGSCHTIRGTAADGVIGPDLTHVGGRMSLAATVLPNDRRSIHEFLTRTKRVKPNIRMPQFDMLPEADLADLTAYLGGLR